MAAAGARLEVVAGKAAGMMILVDDELIIGRLSEGAGRLAEDEEISRSHARVTVDAGGLCAIEDLGSTNGTFVNGLRMAAPQSLSEGDTVELGATTLVVRELPQPETVSQPEPPQPTVGASVVPPPPAGVTPAVAMPAVTPPTLVSPPSDERPAETVLPLAPAEAAVNPSTLSLRLEVDFAAKEAHVALDGGPGEPLRLMFAAGRWRTASPPSNEKGST